MLEGAVATLLHQLLGKYVLDLDTENFNVGIFSGHVTLVDLHLKPEALCQLNVPIEVVVGTIGQLRLDIPWSAIWTQTIILTLEDVFITAQPIVRQNNELCAERNRRLVRAAKRHLLTNLKTKSKDWFDGSPLMFAAEHLLRHLVVHVHNVHVRYEDEISCQRPLALGLCIGTITAETTNSKWKANCTEDITSSTEYYQIKMEALSLYCNHGDVKTEWKMPEEFYDWRNAMSTSLQNYTMHQQDFNFIINPMTLRVRMTLNRTSNLVKLSSDVLIQDLNLTMDKKQFDSILEVNDSLKRMRTSWEFIEWRPLTKIPSNCKAWWRYALQAVLEQRVRPRTWSRILRTRQNYRKYVQCYSNALLSPNDTETKMELQLAEDLLSLPTVVIARQHARLQMNCQTAQPEKSWWASLGGAERMLLSSNLGLDNQSEKDHKMTVRIGNLSCTFLEDKRELMLVTLTQSSLSLKPDYKTRTFKMSGKVEGLIIEGFTSEDQMAPIVCSEHAGDSPAYFLRVHFEKVPPNSGSSYKLNVVLEAIEVMYNQQFIEELTRFLDGKLNWFQCLRPGDLDKKLLSKWDLSLNVKIPCLVVPDQSSFARADSLLVLDAGRLTLTTELCQHSLGSLIDNATQNELEELLYTKLHVTCQNFQVLLCDSSDLWRDSLREPNTDLHVLPKTSFTCHYALCVTDFKTLPRRKFNITCPSFKLNISERKLSLLLKFFQGNSIRVLRPEHKPITDWIRNDSTLKQLKHLESLVTLHADWQGKAKDRGRSPPKSTTDSFHENMNEAWARTVDLPGLEDNTSPNNQMTVLYGLSIHEVCVVFSRSTDSSDRQYLVLRADDLTLDLAIMNYGPAYQLSLSTVILTDKQHVTTSGQYLDLLYAPSKEGVDFLTVLYRKVSAQCPDFWTHFHGVETSLVANVGSVNLLLHQEALQTLIKYSKYLTDKIQKQMAQHVKHKLRVGMRKINNFLHPITEVPVPSGAVKFSHSAHLHELTATLGNYDFDVLRAHISGLEVDFLFRANERFVFRSFLSHVLVEQLNDDGSLYLKVLSTDEDKLYDIKYVRNSSSCDAIAGQTSLVNDSFRLDIGKVHVTLLYKLIVQVQRFVYDLRALPVLSAGLDAVRKSLTHATETIISSNSKLKLSITISGPVVLLPQKSSSPNVVILDLGRLHVENIFKGTENDENILVNCTGVSAYRAVITLSQHVKQQQTLIEPISVKLDITRQTNAVTRLKSCDITARIDGVRVTLGNRDLSTIWAIYSENIGEGRLDDWLTEAPPPQLTTNQDDEVVRNLEAFFCEPKTRKLTLKLSLDNIYVILFHDYTELMSSPIRDLNDGLCQLVIEEIDLSSIVYTNTSLDGKLTVEVLYLEELGDAAGVSGEAMFLAPPKGGAAPTNQHVTINQPPIIDVTFHRNKLTDKSCDVIIGPLALTLNVSFCYRLACYVRKCWPVIEPQDLGVDNHGYQPTESVSHNPTTLTISVRITKPELVLWAEFSESRIVTRSEILFDYNRVGGAHRATSVIAFSGLHCFVEQQNEEHWFVRQCDIEFAVGVSEGRTNSTLDVSAVYVRISRAIYTAFTDLWKEIIHFFDLWLKAGLKNKPFEIVSPNENKSIDLWAARKTDDEWWGPEATPPPPPSFKGSLVVPKFESVVIVEVNALPVIVIKSTFESRCTEKNIAMDISCQANYFNSPIQRWEPIIDPVVLDNGQLVPWGVSLRVFLDNPLCLHEKPECGRNKRRCHRLKSSQTSSDGEGEESGEDMTYLEPAHGHTTTNRHHPISLSALLDDSDTETEDYPLDKLTAAITELFSGDWPEVEPSSSEESGSAQTPSHTPDSPLNPPQKPAMFVLVNSPNSLNLTVTPTMLTLASQIRTYYSWRVLNNTTSDFSTLNSHITTSSQVKLFQRTPHGTPILIRSVHDWGDSAPNTPTHPTPPNEPIKCDLYDFPTLDTLNFQPPTTEQLYDATHRNFLEISVKNLQTAQTNCPLDRKWNKLVRLPHNKPGGMAYHVLVNCSGYGRDVSVASPLQLHNETKYALSILYEPGGAELEALDNEGELVNPFESIRRLSVIGAFESYNVPLFVAYHCKLFLQPAFSDSFGVSQQGIWWAGQDLDSAGNLVCTPKDSPQSEEVFALRVFLRRRGAQAHSIPNYIISLIPPITIYNHLPQVIHITIAKSNTSIQPFEQISLHNLNFDKDIKMTIDYQFGGHAYCGTATLTSHFEEKLVVLTSKYEVKNTINIMLKMVRESFCNLNIFAPFWIVNKTALPLEMRSSCANEQLLCYEDTIVPFAFKRRADGRGKRTVTLRVLESNWSSDFGLDAAGTTGLVVCKDIQRHKKYLFFVQIKLASNATRFTKIVTILPSFQVTNQTNQHLRFMEQNEKSDLWLDLRPGTTQVFHPETQSMQMYVKRHDSKVVSQAFLIATPHKTVLRMDKGSALTVEVTRSSSGPIAESFVVIFRAYEPGHAPVLIRNYCQDVFLKIQQKDQSPVTLLSPNYELLYTWDDPTKPRKLLWNIYNNKAAGFFVDISKNGFGEEKIKVRSVRAAHASSTDDSDSPEETSTPVNKAKVTVYWACFRSGPRLQRLLVFTQNQSNFELLLNAHFTEYCHWELLLSMGGLGVSIFTEDSSEKGRKERLYVSITDQPATWQVNVGQKWKPLTLELCAWIEEKYKQHCKKAQLKDCVHVDFERMFLLKPFFAELKRTYSPAIYWHFRKSDMWQFNRLRICSIQIDDKYNNAILLQSFARAGLEAPPDDQSEGCEAPLLDLSLFTQSQYDCDVIQSVNVTMGDFILNLNNDLLVDLGALYEKCGRRQDKPLFTDSDVYNAINRISYEEKVQFKSSVIENLQFSGCAIQLNVNQKVALGVRQTAQVPLVNSLLSFLFPGNLGLYMPVEGVHLRLSPITNVDRHEDLMTSLSELRTQILTQFLQQYYSNVLGLQVLINNFANSPSVEPCNNSSNNKTNLNSLYGLRCLLGHINMSPAALEQCVLEIFPNQTWETIQKIRWFPSLEGQESPIPQEIACRSLTSGIPDAMRQLLVKGSNLNFDGGEIFFRTSGKALLSLLTRFENSEHVNTLRIVGEALRRAALLGEPLRIQQRLTRYCNRFLGVRPCSTFESMGQYLLETVSNGRFMHDTYWAHCAVDKQGKSIVLVSLEHVLRISKSRMWDNWEPEWTVELDEIVSVPKIQDMQLVLDIRQINGSNSKEQIKIESDKVVLVWLHQKIEQAMIVSLEDRSWTISVQES